MFPLTFVIFLYVNLRGETENVPIESGLYNHSITVINKLNLNKNHDNNIYKYQFYFNDYYSCY